MQDVKGRAFKVLDSFLRRKNIFEEKELLLLHSVIDSLVIEYGWLFSDMEINRLKYYKLELKNHIFVEYKVDTSSENEKIKDRTRTIDELSNLYFKLLGRENVKALAPS